MRIYGKATDVEVTQSYVDFPPCPSAVITFEDAFSDAIVVIRCCYDFLLIFHATGFSP